MKSCVPVFQSDLDSFPKDLLIEKPGKANSKRIIKGTDTGVCPLLAPVGCSKYELRPFACREFPLQIVKINNSLLEVDLLYNCPGLFTQSSKIINRTSARSLAIQKGAFSDYKAKNIDSKSWNLISKKCALDPLKMYDKLKTDDVFSLANRLKNQVNIAGPLIGYDLKSANPYAFYFQDQHAVLKTTQTSKIIDLNKISKPSLESSSMLITYLKNLWQRSITRLELAKEKDERPMKQFLEGKVFDLALSIGIITCNLRNFAVLNNQISAETIIMLDSIILQSIPNLKKNL